MVLSAQLFSQILLFVRYSVLPQPGLILHIALLGITKHAEELLGFPL